VRIRGSTDPDSDGRIASVNHRLDPGLRHGRYDSIDEHSETAVEGIGVIRAVSHVRRQKSQHALEMRLYNIHSIITMQ